jgi:hypothetical protein
MLCGEGFFLPSITPLSGVLELGPQGFFGGSAGTKVQDNPRTIDNKVTSAPYPNPPSLNQMLHAELETAFTQTVVGSAVMHRKRTALGGRTCSHVMMRHRAQRIMTCFPLFRPHENLSDEVNRKLVQSEIEGGVRLQDLEPGSMLRLHTENTCYEIIVLHGGSAYLSGHPLYCPQPVLVTIAGSTWGGSMLKLHFIGRGMHLEFRHPGYSTPIVTSIIQEIRDCRRTAVDRPGSQVLAEWFLGDEGESQGEDLSPG